VAAENRAEPGGQAFPGRSLETRRKFDDVFVYGYRCSLKHVRTERQRPLVGCGDSALGAGEPHRSRSPYSEILDLKPPQMRFIPLRGTHHILRSQGEYDTVFVKQST